MGGSNSGLLMGATLTKHPGIAHAIVSDVGIYDMLRIELAPNGVYNISEFGTEGSRAVPRALRLFAAASRDEGRTISRVLHGDW